VGHEDPGGQEELSGDNLPDMAEVFRGNSSGSQTPTTTPRGLCQLRWRECPVADGQNLDTIKSHTEWDTSPTVKDTNF